MPEPRAARPHRPQRRGPTRRELLQRAALLSLGAPTLGALLEACTRSTGRGAVPSGSLTLAAPTHPVTWPISKDNAPIPDGATPEQGATLRLYNYADYIGPGVVKDFEKKYARYDVNVTVSTFNDTDEAITKIRTGAVPYDIYFPSYDQISRMVAGGLIRPLNHSYISNIDNLWPVFQNPWYDQQWRYSVPYSVYTTGIGWRTDKVSTDIATLPNPYDTLWNPRYAGQTAVIDDWHTAMAMCLLRAGKTDINTASAGDLDVLRQQLEDLAHAAHPKVTITMYNDLPGGQLGQCQMWSGDVVNAQYYLPKGTSVDVLRYWFPPDGKGMVDNDLMVILSGGKNPVLAHLFIQHMLETDVALKNFGYIGYQPPQRSLDTDTVVQQGFVPANLKEAVVLEEYFDIGYRLLELSPDNDAAWHRIWLAFTAGCCGVALVYPPRRRLRLLGRNILWPLLSLPGIAWLCLFFLAPLYVVLAIVFGRTDPLFRTPVPIWNPLDWRGAQFGYVLDHIVGADGIFGPALLRTLVYVLLASAICMAIAFPVAYYVARLAGRRRGLILALLIAPFWISYMMRMLAWVNLLADDGLVNKALGLGLFDVHITWLTGRSVVVVLGLVYGYVPYMILPLYAGLDRLPQSTLEAARDLGANRVSAFVRVVLPMCRPTIIAAVLLTCLPMLGDYFTNDLLSGSPRTSMVGNLINETVLTPGQTGYAGAFVMLVLVVSLLPMFYYVRSVARADLAAT